MIDLLPADGSDPIDNAFTIINELNQYSEKLTNKPRWLVFNKVDLMPEEEAQEKIEAILDALAWDEDYYCISALNRMGTKELTYDLMRQIESMPAVDFEDDEEESEEKKVEFKWDDYHEQQIKNADKSDDDDDDWMIGMKMITT